MNINNKLCCAGPDWLITLQINTKVNKEQMEKRYPKVIKWEKRYLEQLIRYDMNKKGSQITPR